MANIASQSQEDSLPVAEKFGCLPVLLYQKKGDLNG